MGVQKLFLKTDYKVSKRDADGENLIVRCACTSWNTWTSNAEEHLVSGPTCTKQQVFYM